MTERPLILLHLSDLHLGSVDEMALATIAADATSLGADASVITGDLTMRARPAEFGAAREFLAALPGARLVIPGNHDIGVHNPLDRIRDPFAGFRVAISDDLDPVLRLPGVTVLGLTSMPWWRWKSGHVSGRQAGLVRRVLGAAPGRDWRIVATHHPLVADRASRIAGHHRLRDALGRSGVHLALSGHLHVPNAVELGPGVLAVGAGTATSTRVRGGVAQSYNVIRVWPDRVSVAARDWSAGSWAERVLRDWPRPAPRAEGQVGPAGR